MKYFINRYLRNIEWLLGATVVLLSLLAWLTVRGGSGTFTIYDVFPPLGLVAFGLMWTHYVTAALRRYTDAGRKGRDWYRTVSMGLVLALLILHPGLLLLGLYVDGYGLPPGSYLQAYGSQSWLVLMGTVSLMIFLAYELHRWYGNRSWWRYVEYLQLPAMALILVHAVGLGGELSVGWFRLVWAFYGVTLLFSVVYVLVWDNKQKGKI
jgi:hypothetical protein